MKTRPTENLFPSSTVSQPNLVRHAVAFWEQRLGRTVTAEEAREMIENVVGYFTLLAKWDSAEKDAMSSDDSNRPHQ